MFCIRDTNLFICAGFCGALFLTGCGGGLSPETLRRAESEFTLAVGLMEENNVPGAFEHALGAIRLNPNYAEAHHLLGLLYFGRHEFPLAETHLRKALEVMGRDDVDVRPSLGPEIRNSLGVLMIELARYEEAITELRGVTADLLYTTPHIGWANLGLAYAKNGNSVDAIRCYEQAIRLRRDFCLAYLRLGDAQVTSRQFEVAERTLTTLVEFPEPACRNHQEAWRLRGEARSELGHRADAIQDFERCVELGQESDAGRTCATRLEQMH